MRTSPNRSGNAGGGSGEPAQEKLFDLLVAERELISAKAEARKIQARWLTASSSGAPRISAEQEADMLAAEKTVAVPASKVKS